MPYRIHQFYIASGASISNKQFVGPHFKTFLHVSGVTSFNAAAGNTTIQVQHGIDETTTMVLMTSVATETAKGLYELTNAGAPFMQIRLATVPTGSATNALEVIVYSNDL